MEKINVRVFKPRRRKSGRLVISKFYHLAWSVKRHGHGQYSLNVRDQQVAEKLKSDFICEKERELGRIIAPRQVRDAANRLLTQHLADFVAYMRGLNRSASHISHVRTRVGKLIEDCGWRYLSDITANSFELWRQKKANELSIKTRNE